MLAPVTKLNNGLEIPLVGLGTWQAKPSEVSSAVAYAIKAGYRHIDCAWIYENEIQVGEGIRASEVPRSEIFITSKVWGTYHSRVEGCLDQTLANLGTDYLDLYLIHWPVAMNPNGNHQQFPTLPSGERDVVHEWEVTQTWKQMEAVLRSGKVRAIGVSNFSAKMLNKLLSAAEIFPAVNQLEIHLYNPEHQLVADLRSKGILPQAYSPLGSTNSPLLSDETVAELGRKHSLPPAAILLGYLLAKNIVILPKSVTDVRITSNYTDAITAAQKLDKLDIDTLDRVAEGGKQKRFNMPPWPVDLGFDNWTPSRGT